MDTTVIDWLLEDNSWLKFAVETQLLQEEVKPLLATTDSKIQIVINRLKDSSVGIGNDFLKLKYPAVKYGILRVLDVLSLYPYATKSPEFSEMVEFVMNKSSDGKLFAESVSRSYSEFDFGQTKLPSKWITFWIYRILKRIGH